MADRSVCRGGWRATGGSWRTPPDLMSPEMRVSPLKRRRLLIAATIPEQVSTSFMPHLAAFMAAGWDVHVVCAPGEWPAGPQPPTGVVVHRISMAREVRPLADAQSLVKMLALMRQVRPDVVIGGSPKGALLSMVAARMMRVPRRVYLCRGARWETATGRGRQVLLAAERVTARAATETVAVSLSLAEVLVADGVTTRPARVFGRGGDRGVDLTVFQPSDTLMRTGTEGAGGGDLSAETADSVVRNSPVLGFIGRLAADKGVSTVVAAFDAVRELYPDARLWLAGIPDPTDPLPVELTARLAHDPAISTLGWTQQVPDLLRDCDVLVFPSAREGLPNAVLEAAASGVPTVGWDVTGVRDAIDDGLTGRLVPPGDKAGFIAAVQEVLAAGREAYAETCRDWATSFDQRRLTKAWCDFLVE